MEQIKLTKNNVIKTLNIAEDFNTEIDSFVSDVLKLPNITNEAKNTFIFRTEQMYEVLRSLNTPRQNLYMLGGFQGTGKTTFLKTLALTLESYVLFFYYECSSISNLDDIILSLYSFLEEFPLKDDKIFRSNKPNESVDEKLMNILKVLDRPLVIVLDGFESILKDSLDLKDNEIKTFLEHLLSTSKIKLILSSKKNPVLSFENAFEPICSLRLGSLELESTIKILNDNNVTLSDQETNDLYEVTRGYPESIKLLINASKVTNTEIKSILEEYQEIDDSFESFIFQKIYNNIPAQCKEIADLLATIRHPLTIEAINKLKLFENVENNIDYLNDVSVITKNNNEYYIKDFFKNIIYSQLPESNKSKLHNCLNELYKEQIEIPLKNRVLPISKKLLYSEKYYHYNLVSKFRKKLKAEGNQPNPILISSYYNNKYDLTFLPQNINDIVETDKAEKIKTQQYKNIVKVNNMRVELTDEEQKLLDDENYLESELTQTTARQQKQDFEKSNQPIIEDNKEKTPEELKDELILAAQTCENNKQLKTAINYYKKASDILSDIKEYQQLANITEKIANLYSLTNKSDFQIEYLLKALGLFTNLNDNENTIEIIFKIANAYYKHYKHEMALKYYYMILNTEVPVKESIENNVLIGIGDIYNYRKDYNLALSFYLKAFSKVRYYDDIETKCALCFKIALIYDDLGNQAKALAFYQKNLELSLDVNLNHYIASVYSNIAVIYEEANQKNKAISYFLKSLEIDRSIHYYEGQYKTLSTLANIYFEQENNEKTLMYLMEGFQAAKLSGDKYCIAMSFLDIGDFYLMQKTYEKAIKAFIKAKKSIGQVISTDSKEKIDRRFKQIITEIGEKRFNTILESFRRKND